MEKATLKDFNDAMMEIYEAGKRLKPPYNASRFLKMLNEHGGKKTADLLLATDNPSDGFTELFMRGKENLRLCVEYVVLQSRWRELFTPEQLAIARKRLLDCECPLPPEETV
ncbi:MAG: hypothetical protein HS116_21145 [Planctomycetes bacterium]|nr:hypothetical protein [Planctomycetota bacterium]